MRGHGLMQAIARVNRVFKDKPGGLVVDYLGLAEELKQALADYTNSKGKGDITLDQEEAVAVMLEKYEHLAPSCTGLTGTRWHHGETAKTCPVTARCAGARSGNKRRQAAFLRAVSELVQSVCAGRAA